MAILGHFFARFPVFFDSPLTQLKLLLATIPDGTGNAHIYVLLFTPVLGIKRGARLIQKKRSMNSSCRHFQPG
ncbi:TPA: hypothetical protein ACJIWU_003969 [Enterobacter chengduensis]|nr:MULTISPECIES: hypothetical protein [Enterobacter cloacae complex]MBN9879687.1 hypothetical protein [Enterobacter chengduensis]MBT1935792.1 hypothetical protein [Enterobacter chengduensis]MBT1964240.1 hypothetical protein [Enterobacter chengduensis]MCG0455858.1 hypothetical protein [Enterobacter cloacae complex sp. ECC445]MCK1099295.1 hypothetical protein [Enterobacter chengduensis]